MTPLTALRHRAWRHEDDGYRPVVLRRGGRVVGITWRTATPMVNEAASMFVHRAGIASRTHRATAVAARAGILARAELDSCAPDLTAPGTEPSPWFGDVADLGAEPPPRQQVDERVTVAPSRAPSRAGAR